MSFCAVPPDRGWDICLVIITGSCNSSQYSAPVALPGAGSKNPHCPTLAAHIPPGDIRLGLLAAVRRSSLAQCAHGERENRSVRGGFLQLGQDPAPSPEDIAAAARRAAGFAPLGRDCPLLARKFGEGVVAQALALFLRCHPSIGVLNGGDCRDGRGLSHRLASAALPWAAAAAVCSAAALLSGAMALLLQALFLQHLAEHAPHDAPQV